MTPYQRGFRDGVLPLEEQVLVDLADLPGLTLEQVRAAHICGELPHNRPTAAYFDAVDASSRGWRALVGELLAAGVDAGEAQARASAAFPPPIPEWERCPGPILEMHDHTAGDVVRVWK